MMPRHARHTVKDPERGSTTLEVVMWGLVLALLLFGPIQIGLWYTARDIARHSASEALQAAQVATADDSGYAAADRVLDGSSSISDTTVDIDRDGALITVTVTGASQTLIPGWDLTVSQSASGPMIEYTTP